MSEKEQNVQKKNSSVRNKQSGLIKNGASCVDLDRVNDAILRFIIEDMQPFNRTESKAFQNLLAGNFLIFQSRSTFQHNFEPREMSICPQNYSYIILLNDISLSSK